MINRSRSGGHIIPKGVGVPSVIGGKTYTPAAEYPSSTGNKTYTVCEVSDGTISCGCLGWTRRNPPGGRNCKHTLDYEATLRSIWNSPSHFPKKGVDRKVLQDTTVQAGPRERGGSMSAILERLKKEGN